jgi:hypothetical protein
MQVLLKNVNNCVLSYTVIFACYQLQMRHAVPLPTPENASSNTIGLHPPHMYNYDGGSGNAFSVIPLAVLGLRELPLPSVASRSKKSDHSSAKLSLLALCSIRVVSAFSDSVLGTFRNGANGTRRELAIEGPAPGLVNPDCSFCSTVY